MPEWRNKSGNVRVKFWMWPLVLSIIVTVILNFVLWLASR